MLKRPHTLEGQFWYAIGAGFAVFVLLSIGASVLTYQRWAERPNEKPARQAHEAESLHPTATNIIGTVIFAPTTNTTDAKADKNYSSKDNTDHPSNFWLDVRFTDMALVFFTYRLVIVGYYTMRSGERSSRSVERAAIAIEISDGDLATQMTNVRFPGSGTPKKPKVSYYFLNPGRTAATVDNVRRSFQFSNAVPDDPPYFGVASTKDKPEVILPSRNDDSRVLASCEAEDALDKSTVDMMAGGGTFGFFFGAINYTDVFGDEHETGWCFRSERDGSFKRWGGNKFNYRT